MGSALFCFWLTVVQVQHYIWIHFTPSLDIDQYTNKPILAIHMPLISPYFHKREDTDV